MECEDCVQCEGCVRCVIIIINCRLVEEHSKTLERVNDLWKQKWPVNWDEVNSHISHTPARVTIHLNALNETNLMILITSHTLTLHTPSQAWEEKHVTINLDSAGLAGFSLVGGRDQPQLPNPGAFIVTTVNQGGPAEGHLK